MGYTLYVYPQCVVCGVGIVSSARWVRCERPCLAWRTDQSHQPHQPHQRIKGYGTRSTLSERPLQHSHVQSIQETDISRLILTYQALTQIYYSTQQCGDCVQYTKVSLLSQIDAHSARQLHYVVPSQLPPRHPPLLPQRHLLRSANPGCASRWN